MDLGQLFLQFPDLWHVTFKGGWEGIRDRGLLRAIDVAPETSTELRPTVTTVDHRGNTRVTLRNQVRSRLDPAPYLDGITPEEWWQLVNGRVYFFCRPRALEKLLLSYLGQNLPQEVIRFRPRALLEPVVDHVEVTTVNAAVFPHTKGPTRGPRTFVKLKDFPASDVDKIQEITVSCPVPVPLSAVTSVVSHEGDGRTLRLYP